MKKVSKKCHRGALTILFMVIFFFAGKLIKA